MCIEPYITASPHKPNADLMKKLDEREHVCVLSMKLMCVFIIVCFSPPPPLTVLIMQSSQCRVAIAIKMKSLFDWKKREYIHIYICKV